MIKPHEALPEIINGGCGHRNVHLLLSIRHAAKKVNQIYSRIESMKRSSKWCYYYCDGYCFYYGDTGEVCDTGNNAHDGYCPMRADDEELERIADSILCDLASIESCCPSE